VTIFRYLLIGPCSASPRLFFFNSVPAPTPPLLSQQCMCDFDWSRSHITANSPPTYSPLRSVERERTSALNFHLHCSFLYAISPLPPRVGESQCLADVLFFCSTDGFPFSTPKSSNSNSPAILSVPQASHAENLSPRPLFIHSSRARTFIHVATYFALWFSFLTGLECLFFSDCFSPPPNPFFPCFLFSV